jgi:hypothetical protein
VEALSQTSIFQLKISLKGLIPPIWRRVQVDSSLSLSNLHRVLQIVMGWGQYHHYQFIIAGIPYREPPPALEPNLKNARQVKLAEVVGREGDKFIYVYDLSDDWQHIIKLEKILPPQPGVDHPLCLAGGRACPPEECGGIWEYANLLEIIQNPTHPDYLEMIEHFGGNFDPEAFDLARINRALRPIR